MFSCVCVLVNSGVIVDQYSVMHVLVHGSLLGVLTNVKWRVCWTMSIDEQFG